MYSYRYKKNLTSFLYLINSIKSQRKKFFFLLSYKSLRSIRKSFFFIKYIRAVLYNFKHIFLLFWVLCALVKNYKSKFKKSKILRLGGQEVEHIVVFTFLKSFFRHFSTFRDVFINMINRCTTHMYNDLTFMRKRLFNFYYVYCQKLRTYYYMLVLLKMSLIVILFFSSLVYLHYNIDVGYKRVNKAYMRCLMVLLFFMKLNKYKRVLFYKKKKKLFLKKNTSLTVTNLLNFTLFTLSIRISFLRLLLNSWILKKILRLALYKRRSLYLFFITFFKFKFFLMLLIYIFRKFFFYIFEFLFLLQLIMRQRKTFLNFFNLGLFELFFFFWSPFISSQFNSKDGYRRDASQRITRYIKNLFKKPDKLGFLTFFTENLESYNLKYFRTFSYGFLLFKILRFQYKSPKLHFSHFYTFDHDIEAYNYNYSYYLMFNLFTFIKAKHRFWVFKPMYIKVLMLFSKYFYSRHSFNFVLKTFFYKKRCIIKYFLVNNALKSYEQFTTSNFNYTWVNTMLLFKKYFKNQLSLNVLNRQRSSVSLFNQFNIYPTVTDTKLSHFFGKTFTFLNSLKFKKNTILLNFKWNNNLSK